ncbi:MAG: amidohydrolase family protein [Clostridiales bacterium]|nr:amidohydrolase family protein [Clostridiales bacterium]
METQCFDSNVCVGKRGRKHRLEQWSTEHVLDAMSKCGVSAALVHSGWAKDYSPIYGNERLIEELKKSERLFGCYTILPGMCGDFPAPDETIADMRAKGMVAAKIFPAYHNFSVDEISMGEYFGALERERLPLLIDKPEISFEALEKILANHPSLPVLLQGVYWNEERFVIALLKEYENLHIDFSCMQTNFAVERLVEKIGAERLVLGSGMPRMNVGAARSFIDYAEISGDDKRKILGENLARLCGVKLPEPARVQNDEIALQASEGKPVSVFVFDSHAHFLEEGGGCVGNSPMPKGGYKSMEALYAGIGIDKYCVAPWLGIWTDSEAGNRIMLDMTIKSPDKAVGYVLIDPAYVDVEAEARKYHIEHRIPGIKMFRYRTCLRYNDPVFDPWWEIADEHCLFALMDSGYYPEYLSDMEDLAVRYPDVYFFLDHAGRDFNSAESYAALAKKYDNIYLQLTFTSVTQGLIEYLVAEGLEDRTLFGTDSPMRDPRPQLGWVAYADIPISAKKKILGENMQRILGRCFPNDNKQNTVRKTGL